METLGLVNVLECWLVVAAPSLRLGLRSECRSGSLSGH